MPPYLRSTTYSHSTHIKRDARLSVRSHSARHNWASWGGFSTWSRWLALHLRETPCGSCHTYQQQASWIQFAGQLHRPWRKTLDPPNFDYLANSRSRSWWSEPVAVCYPSGSNCLNLLKWHNKCRLSKWTDTGCWVFDLERQASCCSRASRSKGSVCPACGLRVVRKDRKI